jgi:hypothetical protein
MADDSSVDITQGNGFHRPLCKRTTAHSGTSTESRRSTYVEFIKSCYNNHPEAFGFYEQLVDYLRKTCASQEKPTLFEAWPVSLPPEFYPASFPFEALDWEARAERPRVAIVEGFPSPDVIQQLGTKWNLRPEFFIGHIFAGSSNNQRAGFYGLPTLPSRQDSIVCIQFTSLVKSLVEGPSVNSYLEKRMEVEKACRQCEKDLLSGKGYGATRFREINQHDAYYCSVEQTISFTIVSDRKPWVGK